jgi:hypothetical protein
MYKHFQIFLTFLIHMQDMWMDNSYTQGENNKVDLESIETPLNS